MRTSTFFFLPLIASLILPNQVNAQRNAASAVYATFERKGTDTELIGLAVGDLLPGMKVTLNCTGASCPFEAKTINIESNVKMLALTDLFIDPLFKPGTTLEIRILKPGAPGKLFQYETIASAEPRVTRLCLQPGSSKGTAC